MRPGVALCDDRHDVAARTLALRSFRHVTCARDGVVSDGSLTSCLPVPRPDVEGEVHVAAYVNVAAALTHTNR
jgi:hypothetical protein